MNGLFFTIGIIVGIILGIIGITIWFLKKLEK